ncbi:hypothetical protein Vadar_014852 [Vaccinium darrowii]|uniref:Uncharacterized protein n=1 Tax=Vaccinium darrowii TaxID=229202 RepID=A0ACB7X1D2_9ERIC|nr:hypothetical protein Vadar_014852 [Vaccinium darrowii]
MMEFLGKVFEIVKNIGEQLEIGKTIKEWYEYHSGLEESMQNLKRERDYLSAQENDINDQIRSAEHRPWKKLKTEVEVWLKDKQLMENDVQNLEREVVGERSIFSRARLGKRVIKKIQEVEKLQEKGRAFDGLLVDDFPTRGLLMPPTKDFVESTKARNVERVWECLMNEDIGKIGVYGMGGVGKTTIMKHIYNQISKGTDKFDIVYWVTISKAFEIPKLQSDIAKALNLPLSSDEDETIRARELYAALSRNKKYVLILDDLWEAFRLERVGIPEPTQCNGCKIVLTTRTLDVCRRMDCRAVKVELLTEQEALTLFLKKVVRKDVELAPDVKPIAAIIAKKCARLPLAIITVAGSLRRLEGIHEWRDALNEFTNLMNEVSGGENAVFEQLKFSYSRLGDKVVQDCFLYCSLFPEDCEIAEYQLIELWIAEGLIPEMNSVEAMVDKCHSILGKLTSTCLLETASEFGSRHVRIHDVIRDMAFKITGGRYRCMEKDGGLWSEDHEKISFIFKFNHRTELPIRPPVCPRLTTLLLQNNGISLIPDSFFNNMPCLRVLDLSHNIIQSLPESIANLENLHALILSGCEQLEYVPSMEKLKALKVFILTGSLIKEAPKGIEQLVNLIKLDLSYNRRLETFPSTKLCGLSKLLWLIIDATRVQVSREDLMCLSQLKVVCVQFHNVQELTMYLTSRQFHGLEQYRLRVGETIVDYYMCSTKLVAINIESKHFQSGVEQLVVPEDSEEFVLRGSHDLISLSSMPSLKNTRRLRQCEVGRCNRLESIFSSSSFSEDGQISLSSVPGLTLFDLPSCRVLFDGISPAHNISFNLTQLIISNCHSMKYILPAQLLQNLPNLETLEVKSCESVEEIIVGEEEMNGSHHRDDSNTITFPRLKELRLIFLPRLKSIYTGTMVCETEFNIRVNACPMLRRLPLSLHMDNNQATSPPSLKHIRGDEEWWESLEWDDPRTKTILQPFFNRGTYFLSSLISHYVSDVGRI